MQKLIKVKIKASRQGLNIGSLKCALLIKQYPNDPGIKVLDNEIRVCIKYRKELDERIDLIRPTKNQEKDSETTSNQKEMHTRSTMDSMVAVRLMCYGW